MTSVIQSNSGGSTVGSANAGSQVQPDAIGDLARTGAGGRSARVYLLVAFVLAIAGLGMIALANRLYAPEMYDRNRLGIIADAFSNGQSYAVFDLNLNIRELRDEQISRLSLTPNIIILGASQWQEASTDLLGNRHALNAHIHRDYYEDVLGMVEILTRHERLPRDLVITVRDRLFTPIAQRTDYLWLPGVPYYRAMAKRLSLDAHAFWETQPLQRPRELLSLSMLFSNAARWHKASAHPHPTMASRRADLDLLLPDGSIRWSDEHLALFTQDRSRKVALAHADASRNRPPVIDPKGVEALDTLLSYLAVRGVRVHLAHPPFNPVFFESVQNTPYMEGLNQIEAVTRELAAKHKLNIVGSFDPADLGCSASMFIDAEHANASCLSRLMSEIADSIDLPMAVTPSKSMADVSHKEIRARRTLIASGWIANESLPESEIKHATPVALSGQVPGHGVVPELSPSQRPAGTMTTAEPAAPAPQTPPPSRSETGGSMNVPPPVPTSSAPDHAGTPQPIAPDDNHANRVQETKPAVPRKAAAHTPKQRPSPRVVVRKLPTTQRASTAAQQGLVWPGDHPRAYR